MSCMTFCHLSLHMCKQMYILCKKDLAYNWLTYTVTDQGRTEEEAAEEVYNRC